MKNFNKKIKKKLFEHIQKFKKIEKFKKIKKLKN